MTRSTQQRLGVATRALLVLATISILVAAGDFSASAYQGAQVNAINAEVQRAHARFLDQVKLSVADGTPATLLGSVTALELDTFNENPPRQAYFIDRVWLDTLRQRVKRIESFRS